MDSKHTFSKMDSSKSGVVLVETLISIALFAIFIAAAGKLIMMNREMSDVARAHYTAANIAKNRMELVRTSQFSELSDFAENQKVVDADGLPDDHGIYRRSTQFTSVSSNLLEMAITVEIRSRKTLRFDAGQQQLTTLLADYLSEDSSPGSGTASGP